MWTTEGDGGAEDFPGGAATCVNIPTLWMAEMIGDEETTDTVYYMVGMCKC